MNDIDSLCAEKDTNNEVPRISKGRAKAKFAILDVKMEFTQSPEWRRSQGITTADDTQNDATEPTQGPKNNGVQNCSNLQDRLK